MAADKKTRTQIKNRMTIGDWLLYGVPRRTREKKNVGDGRQMKRKNASSMTVEYL